ncbi:YfbU family protein [Avibacterium sp. 21-586]|uniref:YfbU family protein n=1 Tax=Avibacterium sp. 21-586 TaxID=2911534 RepID=UPI002245FC14|nr:YfbU family protein [Avibacterium sp. 21-586]MCW9710943.1 YfbU family protein [Avibacterium sp. 21-586]
MEMTSTQRLILANQYKLMGLLDPNNAAKYARFETIVKGGFGLELKELDKEFSNLSEQECQTVRDTLEMYHALQVSYNNLGDTTSVTPHRLQFAGYCAVREKKYLNYLRFITTTEGKYSEFMQCEHGCDSQTPMWDKYIKMLEAWRSCPHEYHLSMAEIEKILNA